MVYRVLGALSFVAVIVVGCTSDDCPLCTGGSGGTTATTSAGGAEGGSGGSGGGVADACPGIAPNSNAACDACRAVECCTEAQACAAEPECLAWLECEDACAMDDMACLDGCWRGFPADEPKAECLACRMRECADECGDPACDGNYNYFDAGDGWWRECQNLHCCTELESCWENADCVGVLECFATTEPPYSHCNSEAHVAGMMALMPAFACRTRYCWVDEGGLSDCSELGYDGDCAACVNDHCCGEAKACSEDADCLQYAICDFHCGADEACRTECTLRFWKGAGLRAVQNYCLATSCSSQCSEPARTCGGFSYPNAACAPCMETSCCDEGQACGSDSECAGLALCVAACASDTTCIASCRMNALPYGVSAYDAWQGCLGTECATECAE